MSKYKFQSTSCRFTSNHLEDSSFGIATSSITTKLVPIPKLEPSRWLEVNLHDVDWNLYLNTLFWNLNYWDSISTLAGEVDNPKRTLPKSLLCTLILVVLGYFFPLLIGTSVVPVNHELWIDSYFSDIVKIIGGVWLRWWIQGASIMSNMEMYVAEMSSDSFQLLGMAERGMLPEFFGKRPRYGTPLIGILFSAFGVLLLSWLSFQEIVAAEKFLVLLRNDFGIPSICMVMSKTSI